MTDAPDAPARLALTALAGIPEIAPGDDLATAFLDALSVSGEQVHDGDVLVIAQKIVSKSEDRFRRLSDTPPSARALDIAELTEKDPRLVELILSEAAEVMRTVPGVIVVRHRNGYVLANAGIDASNVGDDPDEDVVLLLPEDADASAQALRSVIKQRTGCDIGVIVNDSLGRAWRNGTVGVALGAAGIDALSDQRGRPDRAGRAQRVTEVGLADELAAAASALMGQSDESRPMVLIRGAPTVPGIPGNGSAADLIRPVDKDLFR